MCVAGIEIIKYHTVSIVGAFYGEIWEHFTIRKQGCVFLPPQHVGGQGGLTIVEVVFIKIVEAWDRPPVITSQP